jgi:trehalose 6-phosphate synthase/phosphatase
VHAALNAGVKSLAENSKVLMLAWPGDLRDTKGDRIGTSDLSEKQKKELEEGFQDISGRSESTGVACVPVWMEDKTASTFYNEYCKAFLWPTFHYLGLTDHQAKDKEAKAWKAYYDANVAYAEKVAEVYKEGDLVGIG